jgi:predicted permease
MLSAVYAWRVEPEPMSLANGADAERVYGTRVSGNYFTAIGARPQFGRAFVDADDRPGHNEVVVLSDELWKRRFGADPSVVGTAITLTGRSYMVVGIAPRGFQGTTILKSDLWLPLTTQVLGRSSDDMLTNRRIMWLFLGGRLARGVTVAQANAELTAIGQTITREHPAENAGRGVRIEPVSIFPGRIQVIAGFIGVLMAIVALVLLIACVNVAGMLLARAAARRREIAVRLAIGAGRGRLVRQLLTETAVLFACGGIAGLLLSRWLIAGLLALLPQLPVPIGMDIVIDWRVLTFAVAASLAAAVLSGLAPALQASRTVLVPSLKTDTFDAGPGRLRLRNAFLVAQITMSLLLVVVGGLFVRALQHAGRMDPGFDQTNVDVVSIDLSLAGYKETDGLAFTREFEGRVRALPGVNAAVMAVDLPLDGGRMSFGDVRLPGTPRTSTRNTEPTDWNIVTPGFFSTMKVRLLRGRDFTEHDTAGAPGVVIVNNVLARRLFGTADPIGRDVELDTGFATPRPATVVGLAADAQFVALGESTPYIYAPLAQQYHPRLSLLVKSSGQSEVPAVRSLIHELNPRLPVIDAMPLSDITAIGLVPQRIAASVAGALGLVGLVLAAIGIYGVTSYAVARRTREIGIRVALGATRTSVLRLVLRQGMSLTAIGTAIGLVAAAAGAQVVRSLLFGVSVVDPPTFAGAAALFLAVAAAASYVPALRASRLEPARALRSE